MPTDPSNEMLARTKEKYLCKDCRVAYPTPYMATEEVWRFAHNGEDGNKGVLCLSCLSSRLRRPLVIEDFLESLPINDGIYAGYQMGLREVLTDPHYKAPAADSPLS